jgi:hypothetical protein
MPSASFIWFELAVVAFVISAAIVSLRHRRNMLLADSRRRLSETACWVRMPLVIVRTKASASSLLPFVVTHHR